MNISCEVEPIEYIYAVKIISRIEIRIFDIQLFKSVTIVATLYDDINN